MSIILLLLKVLSCRHLRGSSSGGSEQEGTSAKGVFALTELKLISQWFDFSNITRTLKAFESINSGLLIW